MKKAFLFTLLLLSELSLHSATAEIELPGYVDPRFGRPRSTLNDLVSATPEPEEMFWLKQSLFVPQLCSDKDEIAALYNENTRSKITPPKTSTDLSNTLSDYVDANTTSVLTYLFKSYLKDDRKYEIPLVVNTDIGRKTRAYDDYYSYDSICHGMGTLEADLKSQCVNHNKKTYGLIEINYSKDLELYRSRIQLRQIPDNGLNESYSFKLLSSFPALLGFWSNHDRTGFKAPLSSFDRLTYARSLNRNVSAGDSFSSLAKNCTYSSEDGCSLFISGHNTRLLFADNQENSVLGFDEKRSLKLHYDENYRPYLNLRNTILSDSTFINYGFYTQAELALLKDLGYEINDREFFGNSVFSSGTPKKRQNFVLRQGFYAWSDTLHDYKNDQPSKIPLSVGTHIYGSYNDVVQQGTIASLGYSSIGIRVDGSYNTVTVPNKTAIIQNGFSASGIAVTYGRDNIINVDGMVEANSEDGVGIRCDFGSNVLSDYKEYQGSYRRVRTQAVANGEITKRLGQEVEAPNQIRGPLVSMINISGSVSGFKNAIYIDESAYVKQINLLNRSKIRGSIVSDWAPYISEDGKSLYAPHQNMALLPGKLQFDGKQILENYFDTRKMYDNLLTRINLGVKPVEDVFKNRLLRYVPDRKSSITIDGDISGLSVIVSSFGGHTNIRGTIDVKRLYIGDSVVNFKGSNSLIKYADELVLSRGAQLDLSNGTPETFVIRKKANISSNSVICVDTDRNGNILDELVIEKELKSTDSVINLEPGLSYNEIKSYQSDPKALLKLMDNFSKNANRMLSKYGVSSKYPKHIWYIQGEMGRQVKCSSRGCHLADFVNSYSKSAEELPAWRYILSIIGCIIMLLVCVFISQRAGSGRFG
ncbi:MAG: hypothetical protein ACI4UM_07510 [Succinivibrio sp.]